jgi:hypothetical protein
MLSTLSTFANGSSFWCFFISRADFLTIVGYSRRSVGLVKPQAQGKRYIIQPVFAAKTSHATPS